MDLGELRLLQKETMWNPDAHRLVSLHSRRKERDRDGEPSRSLRRSLRTLPSHPGGRAGFLEDEPAILDRAVQIDRPLVDGGAPLFHRSLGFDRTRCVVPAAYEVRLHSLVLDSHLGVRHELSIGIPDAQHLYFALLGHVDRKSTRLNSSH